MKPKTILCVVSLFSLPTSLIAQEVKPSTKAPEVVNQSQNLKELEWKTLANQEDLAVGKTVDNFIRKAATAEHQSIEKKAQIQRLKDLLSEQAQQLTAKDLLGLKKVRSIQISNFGIYSYPYFNCRFKKTKTNVFFEKTRGSQRKSGYLYQEDAETFVFLGAWTVNDEAQRQYSGLNQSKEKKYDKAGVFVKRGKTVLAIFHWGKNDFEVYEFK